MSRYRRHSGKKGGAAVTEYALILVAVALLCIVAITMAGLSIGGAFGHVSGALSGGLLRPPSSSATATPTPTPPPRCRIGSPGLAPAMARSGRRSRSRGPG
jgi:Flp pilus assembly pilin Flp